MHLGKPVSTSLRIKTLPPIVLPCTKLDIYPKALGLVNLKYTKAKIKFVKGEMPQIRWCYLQPVDLGDAHSISHMTRSPFLQGELLASSKYIQPLLFTNFPRTRVENFSGRGSEITEVLLA